MSYLLFNAEKVPYYYLVLNGTYPQVPENKHFYNFIIEMLKNVSSIFFWYPNYRFIDGLFFQTYEMNCFEIQGTDHCGLSAL